MKGKITNAGNMVTMQGRTVQGSEIRVREVSNCVPVKEFAMLVGIDAQVDEHNKKMDGSV